MTNTSYQNILISEKEAAEFAEKNYFSEPFFVKKLPGSDDFNFYLKKEDNQELVLKISRPSADLEILDLQTKILEHLHEKKMSFKTPFPIATQNNNFIEPIKDKNGAIRQMRLLTWLDGKVWAKVNPHTPELLEKFGKTCGELSQSLQDFEHPSAHRFFNWNPSEWKFLKENAGIFQQKVQKEIVEYFLNIFEKEVLPIKHQLRKSIIHGDLNDYNVLVSNNLQNIDIEGFIDFGDTVFTDTINELGIACAYALMHKPNPVAAAKSIVKGYHQMFPLTEIEVQVLYHFIAARLLISVTHSAINKIKEPENEYLLISEKPAWNLLKKWRRLSPKLVNYHFREVCGFEICPKKKMFENWAGKNQNTFAEIISLELEKTRILDLSVGSLDLGLNENFEKSEKFSRKINQLLADEAADFGVGGYGEVRPIYTTDDYLVMGNQGPRWRTVHLGLDIWGKAGTKIFAPLDGKVFACHNNIGDRNYGPTLILEHCIREDFLFYTLYGHLENNISFKKNQIIRKGAAIATIGAAPQNGNWPPHLHFQIILDMLDWETDYPGVAFPDEKEIWMNLCPNPVTLFPKLKKFQNPKTSISSDDILKKRQQNLGKNLSVSYQKPLHIVRASGQYLYDANGQRYLDTVNNVPHVGHQHPKVVRAGQRQIAILNTNTRYLHETIIEYSEQLLATFPPELNTVYFVNSGSEANELAIRMAKTATDQQDMIAIETGYHGNTNACVNVSSYKFDGRGGKGAPQQTHILPIPDAYRGIYQKGEQNIGEKYARHIDEIIQKLSKKGRGIAGFIGESILSCGGQIVLPQNYLNNIYRKIRAVGGVCIADEVQVGFGRVGDAFWGFELQNVVPDIVVLGKPIGNGHPLAAVVCTQKIADAFANGMEYFNTFGGNPVSCAIGKSVLEILQKNDLQTHARSVGNYLKTELRKLQKEFPIIGDVRGHGLFLGFELVKNRLSKTPAAAEATYLVNRMRENGILMSSDGPLHNVIKIKPPMCFDKNNADFLVKMLKIVLKEDCLQQV